LLALLSRSLRDTEGEAEREAIPSVTSETPLVTLALREKEADFTFGDL
jgi:hypothetical protein